MKSMKMTRGRMVAGGLLATGILIGAKVLLGPATVAAQPAELAAPKIAPDQFNKLREIIKPKPGGFDDVPWMTDLWQARQKAAAEGKPILIWVGDGHPLGWT